MKMMQNKRLILIIAILLIVITISVCIVAGVNARYKKEQDLGNKQINSVKFYFESQLLESDDFATYIMRTMDFSTFSINFDLENAKDELNYSNCDIDYTVKYSLSTGTDYYVYSTGSLAGNAQRSTTVSIPLSSILSAEELQEDSVIMNIMVETTEPFRSSLYGRFIVRKSPQTVTLKANTAENTNIVRLVVQSRIDGTVTIGYPEGCIPDATDTRMLVDLSERTVTIDVTDYGEYSFVFFKQNPSVSTYPIGETGFYVIEE